jgi:hypothetical protein
MQRHLSRVVATVDVGCALLCGGCHRSAADVVIVVVVVVVVVVVEVVVIVAVVVMVAVAVEVVVVVASLFSCCLRAGTTSTHRTRGSSAPSSSNWCVMPDCGAAG